MKVPGRDCRGFVAPRAWHGGLLGTLAALLPSMLLAAAGLPSQPSQPPVLTRVEQIRKLSPDQAALGYRVRLRGVITYCDLPRLDLFVEDSTGGIYIEPSGLKTPLHAGQQVEVTGKVTEGDFASQIEEPHIEVLGQAPWPRPKGISGAELVSGSHDSAWVEVEGLVRSVVKEDGRFRMKVTSTGADFMTYVENDGALAGRLVGARVQFNGVAGGSYNQKKQYLAATLLVPGVEFLQVLKPAPADLFAIPLSPIHFLLRTGPSGAFDHPVRIQGVVTFQSSQGELYVWDGTDGAKVEASPTPGVPVGTRVEAVGFPGLNEFSPALQDAMVRPVGQGREPAPAIVTMAEMVTGIRDGELVRTSGVLVDRSHHNATWRLSIHSDDVAFEAILEDSKGTQPLTRIRLGSTVQVTGICATVADEARVPRDFSILLRSSDDLVVLRSASWWTAANTAKLATFISVLLLAALAWAIALRGRVRKQTNTLLARLQRIAILEERFRELFENANDMVFTCGLRGHFTTLNKAGERITGYSRDKVIGKSITELVAPEYSEKARQLIDVEAAPQDAGACEVEILTEGRGRVPLEIKTRVIYSQGIAVGIQGIARDIARRKQAEDALARERNLFRTLVDTLPDYIYAKDTESRFLLANKPVAQAMGAESPEELLGKTDFDYYGRELAEKFRADECAVLETGRALLNCEELGRKPDGRPAWFLTSKAPFRDALGEIVGIVGVGRDITERKAADEALLEYEKVVESAQDMMVVVDRDYRYRMANRSFLDYRGLERSKIKGMTVAEVVGQEVFEEWVKGKLDECFAGKTVHYEARYGYSQLGERDLALAFYPIAGPAGIDRAACILRDITELKRSEAALQLREKQLAQAMDLAEMAHWEFDAANQIFAFNDRFYALYGTTAEREGGYKMSAETYAREFLPPEEVDIVRNAIARSLAATGRDASYALEHHVRRRDGEMRHVAVRISVIKDKDGRTIRTRGVNQDITERKRAEEALRESEEKFRGLFQGAAEGIIVTNIETKKFVYANPAICRMLGYTEEELLQLGVSDIHPPQGLEKVGAAFVAMASGEETLASAIPCLRKDGTTIYTDINGSQMVVDGRVCTVGFFTDVTERRRAEQALERSEVELREALQAAQMGVWTWTQTTGAIAWNEDLYRITGLDRKLAPPNFQELAQFYTPQSWEQLLSRIENTLATGTPYELDLEMVRPDGSRRWTVARGRPLRDDGGHIIGLRGTAQDITERKRAEDALRESEKRFRQLADNIDEVFWVSDLQQTKMIYISPAYERIWGVTQQNLYDNPMSFTDAIHPDDRERILAKLPDHARGGFDEEYRIVLPHGSVRWIHARTFTIRDERGEVYRSCGIAQDITARKQADEELRKAKEAAEVANRAKSEFLANMSHEIRTPMNGIIGMTELALDTELSPEQREYLGMVRDSADSLLTLINDILDFSKIEAGKFSLDVAEFELRDHLANALKSLTPRAHQKGLEMIYTIAPDVPAQLVGDPSRLRQILINLVGNAVKFTERGEITLRVEVQSRREEDVVLHFSVADTGVGIPPEKQQSIFDAFSQADSSTTRKYGGTGLGLTISSHLVEMMRGGIWVESEVGRGSTFHFTARLGVQKELATGAAEFETVELEDMRVLVVDDNTTNRRILDSMLKHWKMKPALAEGGVRGLELMIKHKQAGQAFPLVLIDALMPDMDGFTLAEKIKQDPALAGATIMMLTSAGQRGDAARCRELGIEAYLIKPIRQSELLDAILTTLGKPRRGKRPPALVTRHTLREARRKLRILVVEDNAVNQQLAARLLEKRGHVVVLAGNGREALAELESPGDAPGFDLVLMDVQMPELDGLEATALIRKQEVATGKHLPIVAMTAHAMKGDRERCLAAGMDSYVSKPINPEQLFATLHEVLGSSYGPSAVPETKPASPELIDNAALLARVEGDADLLSEMAELFLKIYPKLLEEIQLAVDQKDAAALERAAHALKGSVSNFAARDAFAAAMELEKMASRGDLTHAERACQELTKDLECLKPVLEVFTKGGVE